MSWMRISSASKPPSRKNTKAVTPYSAPMRLWSTVVIQLHSPDSDWGIAYAPAVVVAMVGSFPALLEALEVRDDRRDLIRRQPERRHQRPGLGRRRIRDPSAEVLGVVRHGGARDHSAAREVREVGAGGPLRHAAYGVAGPADARLREHLLALPRQRQRVGLDRRTLLVRDPRVERLRRFDEQPHAHVGVRQPA